MVEGMMLLPVATCVAVLVVVGEVGVLLPVATVSVVDSAEVTATGVEVAEAGGVQQERYEIVVTYVPG